MNEFEWLRQMRALNQPAAPRGDLWSRIDAALDDTAARPEIARATPRRRHVRAWATAASLAALVMLACGAVWRMHAIPQSATPQVASHAPRAEEPRWKPNDPRLAGAALELEAARMELQQAMQQAPDSPALQRLLQQTHAQQNYLRELEKQAG